MLLIGLLLVASIVALCLLNSDKSEKAMKDYYNLECKQNVKSKYKFCC